MNRLSLDQHVAITVSDIVGAASLWLVPGEREMWLLNTTDQARALLDSIELPLDSNSGHTGYHQSGLVFPVFAFWNGSAVKIGTAPGQTSGFAAWIDGDIEHWHARQVNKNGSLALRFGSGSGDVTTVAAREANYIGAVKMVANGQTSDSHDVRFVSSLDAVGRPLFNLGGSSDNDVSNEEIVTNSVAWISATGAGLVTLFGQALAWNNDTGTMAEVGCHLRLDGVDIAHVEDHYSLRGDKTKTANPTTRFTGSVSPGQHTLELLFYNDVAIGVGCGGGINRGLDCSVVI